MIDGFQYSARPDGELQLLPPP